MNPSITATHRPPHDGPAGPARAATVVVGAGIGGLLAALAAADADPGGRVVVLDPHPPGGRARTDHRNGFTFNRGPRALYRRGPAERALHAVGVDTMSGGPPSLRGAIAVAGGATHRFPGTPRDSARTTLFTAREKARAGAVLAALWRSEAGATDGRTLAGWLDDRKLDGVVRQFVEALVRVATYTHAPETVAAAPALAGARAGISPGVRYLDGGWQALVDQLLALAAARGIEPIAATVRHVRPGPTGVTITTDRGDWHAASAVLAVGTPEAATSLLPARPASWHGLAPPVTAACLELGIRGAPSRPFALGIDEPLYGSAHCPPADLAPPGHSVVHLMRYQAVDDPMTVDEQRAQLHGLARHMGIGVDDVVEERFLARMVVAGTVADAARGGLRGRPTTIIDDHPGVFVAGDWVGPTGLLLDAAASSATEAGRRAGERSATMERA